MDFRNRFHGDARRKVANQEANSELLMMRTSFFAPFLQTTLMAVTLAFLVANPQAGMVASGGSLNHARKDINGQEFFYSKAYKGKNLFSPRDCQGHQIFETSSAGLSMHHW
jgi:hypothetical protein